MRLSTPPRSARPRSATAGVAMLAALTTCAPPSARPGRLDGLSPACALVPSSSEAGTMPAGPAHLEMALPGSVDPNHAPVGRNAAERLVFRQLYQTLVALDCTGRVRPGLAVSWASDSSGLRWRFRLRPDARFWDGTPVTAEALARALAAPRVRADAGAPVLASARAEGAQELVLRLAAPTYGPGAFARPSLAVAGDRRPDGWPLGSGPWMPVASNARGGTTLEGAASATSARTLTFRPPPRGDDREALDGGVHLLESADPDVLAYARAVPGVSVHPLPWSRSYVVVAPAASPSEPGHVPGDVLQGLARSAVRADARPAEPPFWWRQDTPCVAGWDGSAGTSVGALGPAEVGRPGRIAYPDGDGVARDLAERLVALAGRGDAFPPWLRGAAPDLAAGGVVAVGMDLSAPAGWHGGTAAWVLALPLAPGGACASAALAAADRMWPTPMAETPAPRITPLLDTRASLVVRSGVGGLFLDGFGTLVFVPDPGGRP